MDRCFGYSLALFYMMLSILFAIGLVVPQNWMLFALSFGLSITTAHLGEEKYKNNILSKEEEK